MPVEDPSLEKDIPTGIEMLKTPVWEPYDLYKKFVGRKKEDKINSAFLSEGKKSGITEKLSVWIRGNFFIPDARMFWIKPSVKFLSDYLLNNKTDAIASTGPPHSMHLIASKLKKKFPLPWLADFRDPWTNIDYYHDLMLTRWADKRHHLLEKMVIEKADAVVTVGKTMKDEFVKKLTKSNAQKFHVITNGYDESDISGNSDEPDKKFSIAHIGSLVKTRNPGILWKALAELIIEIPELKNHLEIKLVGKVDFSVSESIKKHKLINFIQKTEYIEHGRIIGVMKQSQVLLLLLNNTPNAKGILTGKLFEYLAAKRPVLCIGPEDGETAAILAETGAGECVNFNDMIRLKKIIAEYFRKFQNKELSVSSSRIEKYSRRNLTMQLAGILNHITMNSS